ncbi:nuclease-related domain-containing protein [Ureibacillus manganicus]|uniref:NERD domain-containing protein n=1 Tax=Ureibacillus manganicus DSM 26584 TaxID=1384049 RepID=A0A0A3HUU9_9BACL|nr:nuclease-related domain-containing protein [Ureibacillus manganicus]KGR76219.1 hypothetical protein CD29_17195 [Ureibacillus manganicus DSM 26584]
MHLVERTIPSKIIVLDALNRRAPSELIEKLLRRAEIGFRGEIKVDPLCNEMILPQNSILFHNYESNNHQLDTLFVCEHFILILEIKNISGFIWYEEEKHQFLSKKKSGEVESFQSPIEQVKRNGDFIEGVVERLGLTVPIQKAVVIAEPSTVIGKIPYEIPIFHAIGLRTEVNKLLLKYPKPFMAKIHFELLTDELIRMYLPGIYKPKFEIPSIRKGAICICGGTMRYQSGKFVCSCGNVTKEALYQGLHDYRVLFNEWISNKEFREFFMIDSPNLVNKLLVRMKQDYKGLR